MVSERRSAGAPGAFLGYALAMMLCILPLPGSLAPFNPDWLALMLLFRAIVSPEWIGIFTAWGFGLLLDALTGRLLGQHAMAYGVMIYLALRYRDRFLSWSLLLQDLWILLLLMTSQLLVLWTQNQELAAPFRYRYWWPSLTGVGVWVLLGLLASLKNREDMRGE